MTDTISREQELEEEIAKLEDYIVILLKEKKERIEHMRAVLDYCVQLENSIRTRDSLLKKKAV